MSTPGPRGDSQEASLPLQQYLDCLPQKATALFVDEIHQLTPMECATGSVAFPHGHRVFENHLPGNPLVPGVMLIEALAQLSGLILIPPGQVSPIRGYLGEVRRVRFRRKVVPGDRVTLRSRLLRAFGGAAAFKVEALVGDQVAAEGEIIVGGGGARTGSS